ncbi:hypothetical protein LINPERHAP1_LOCUS29270 [Linum perenne]
MEIAWEPGPQDWVVLNTDGSVLPESRSATAGGLLRDSFGRCSKAFTVNLGRCSITQGSSEGFWWVSMWLGRLASGKLLYRWTHRVLSWSRVRRNRGISMRAKSWQFASVSNVTGKSLFHISIERGIMWQITWLTSGMAFLRVPTRSMCRIVLLVIFFVMIVWVSPNP